MNKPRRLTADEAKTWVGLDFGRAEAGEGNRRGKVGFVLAGPAILLGTPADNPLIDAFRSLGFLPYAAGADFPGRGRGYLAWQRDAIGLGQESVTLVAADAEGMAEAVGSLYEAAAGIDPMTPWALPLSSAVAPATINLQPPEAVTRWQAVLPDRVLSLAAGPAGEVTAISLDGSAATLDKAGKVVSQRAASPAEIAAAKKAAAVKPVVPAALTAKLAPYRVPKFVATSAGLTAVAYWGGTLQVFAADGTLKTQQLLPQDISALAWAGNTLIVGQSDGCLLALATR